MKNYVKRNRKTFIYAIITILSFVAVSIGATYAFFAATIIGNNDNGDVTIKTAHVYAVYEAENMINADGIMPGFSDTLRFSVTNTSEVPDAYGNYSLIWIIDTNEIDDNSFVYELVGKTYYNGEEVSESSIPHNRIINLGEFRVPAMSTVLGTGLINTGITHKYELTIKFKETGENQNELRNKTFKSQIVAKGEAAV